MSVLGFRGRGLERPFDVKVGPDGAMYIADYGIARVNLARLRRGRVPYEFPRRSGVIWRVVPRGLRVAREAARRRVRKERRSGEQADRRFRM